METSGDASKKPWRLARWQIRSLSAIILGPVVLLLIWHGGWIFLALILLAAAVSISEWLYLSLKTKHKILFSVIGFFYIGMSFWTFYHLRAHHPVKIALLFVVMLWASDIGAYIFGKNFGGPKMSPVISPNKTWAGFIGATALPGLAGGLYILAYNYVYHLSMFPYELYKLVLVYMGVGALVGLVGQAGDLLISWFKRYVQVKDAGSIIPGHGGVLDRIDAMMLAAPVFLFFVSKFPHVFPG